MKTPVQNQICLFLPGSVFASYISAVFIWFTQTRLLCLAGLILLLFYSVPSLSSNFVSSEIYFVQYQHSLEEQNQ